MPEHMLGYSIENYSTEIAQHLHNLIESETRLEHGSIRDDEYIDVVVGPSHDLHIEQLQVRIGYAQGRPAVQARVQEEGHDNANTTNAHFNHVAPKVMVKNLLGSLGLISRNSRE